MSGDRTAHNNFIAELKALRRRAGNPSLPQLRKLSLLIYQPGDDNGPVELTPSTTSDILAGTKRVQLPSWRWTASFLAACRAAAAAIGLDPDSLGSVAQWLAKWEAADAAAEQARLGGAQAGDHADDTAAAHAMPLPAAEAPGIEQPTDQPDEGSTEPSTVPPPEPTIKFKRYVEAFGRTGGRLLRHAENGVAQAAYRLAVLLLCEGRPQEAQEWLRRADTVTDIVPEALARWPVNGADAAEAAFDLAREYQTHGQPHAALVFYKAAGKRGHAEAAYLIGMHYVDTGKDWDAATWLSRAAMSGNEDAQHEYAAAQRRMSFSGRIPPPLDPLYHPERLAPYDPGNPYSLDSPWPQEPEPETAHRSFDLISMADPRSPDFWGAPTSWTPPPVEHWQREFSTDYQHPLGPYEPDGPTESR